MELHRESSDEERVDDLAKYSIMDSSPEMSFDQFTYLASKICRTPIALLSFIDKDRQWFKSSIGIHLEQIPRYLSACNKTLQEGGGFHEIKDAFVDPTVYADYMKKSGFRFYAGVPITSSEGFHLGSLCVIDIKPRSLNREQKQALKVISEQISGVLEIRKGYRENLQKLKEINDASFKSDIQMQEISYRASTRAMAELSAGLSYRIRTHVYTIKNVIKRAQKIILPPEIEAEVEVVKNSSENIEAILNSLEKFISAEKEKWMRALDLGELIRKVVDHLEYKTKAYQVNLSVSIETELRCVGNYTQLIEVIYAVVVNAIEAVEHMKEKRVEVVLREDDHFGIIEVSDSGRGVSETVKPFIFQPFFSTKGSYSIGTGLSLAQSLIHRHGGEIKLEKPYGPTTFSIRIPVP